MTYNVTTTLNAKSLSKESPMNTPRARCSRGPPDRPYQCASECADAPQGRGYNIHATRDERASQSGGIGKHRCHPRRNGEGASVENPEGERGTSAAKTSNKGRER
jgi:hypothetical protein